MYTTKFKLHRLLRLLLATAFISTIIIMVLCFCSCGNDEEDSYNPDQTVQTVESLLQQQNYEYTNVEVVYERAYTYNNYTYKFYDLNIIISDNYKDNYSYIFNMLTYLDNHSSAYSTSYQIIFSEHVNCCSNVYEISSTNDYELKKDSSVVYNSIAAKNGVDLNKYEKARIYEDIKNRYTYYDNKYGTYTGDKYTDEVFEYVAEKYNVTVEYLKSDVWIYDIYLIWQKEY